MNLQQRPPFLSATTQAADGLPRRRWRVAEIEAMVAKGIILEDERFELIGGEVVPMSPKRNRHEVVKAALQQHWFPRIAGTPINLITETTLHVAEDEFFEPDFLFWPRGIPLKDVTAGAALLIVEIADTSLTYDLGRKAAVYARLGLPELWVINARNLATTIHRGPGVAGYRDPREAGPNESLQPLLATHLTVCLADLVID